LRFRKDPETSIASITISELSDSIGFVPNAITESGPLDALIIVEEPTFPGCHVWARPVALLKVSGDRGSRDRIITVPSSEPQWTDVTDLEHLPQGLTAEIRHFFDMYLDLMPESSVVEGFGGRDEALAAVELAIRIPDKPV
jgi:inorganic pyrophosphatase